MTAAPDLRRIGMLLPSSNTAVERVVPDMLATHPTVSAHSTRVVVTEISLDDSSQSQFQIDTMLAAAELLSHAQVHMMGWNGTAASWLGFDRDHHLCACMTEAFGVPATTATLAVNDVLAALQVRDFALVTPYIDSVQQDIVAQYREHGLRCVAERHSGVRENYAFATIPDREVEAMIRDVAAAGPQAIVVMCTNVGAAAYAKRLEDELGVTVVDSLAAYVWKSLGLAGIDTRRFDRWGRLFRCTGATSTFGTPGQKRRTDHV